MRSLGKVEKGPRINPGFDHIWRRSRGGGVNKGDRRSSSGLGEKPEECNVVEAKRMFQEEFSFLLIYL